MLFSRKDIHSYGFGEYGLHLWLVSIYSGICLLLRPLTEPSKLCSYPTPFSASYPESLLLVTGVLVAVAHWLLGCMWCCGVMNVLWCKGLGLW